MSSEFVGLWRFIQVCLMALIIFAGYSFYYFFLKEKVIKTTTKPVVTWELKGNGQKVDTIFIYTFK